MLQVRQLFQIRAYYYDSKPIIINYSLVTQNLIINNDALFIIQKL